MFALAVHTITSAIENHHQVAGFSAGRFVVTARN
jgi:hypothetical protein